MSGCTDEKLNEFSHEHYTYINQIFGDLTVREIISEVFPNKKYIFDAVESGAEFEGSYHHVLINTKTNEEVCSVDNGYQNIYINKNDNLCQSYSLLTYFNENIHPDQKQRQMDMIKMYRNILNNKKFIKNFKDIIKPKKKEDMWKISNNNNSTVHMKYDMNNILKKIKDVLDNWEEYGYYYFIGEGKCPVEPKKTTISSTRTTRKNTQVNSRPTTRQSSRSVNRTSRSTRQNN